LVWKVLSQPEHRQVLKLPVFVEPEVPVQTTRPQQRGALT
jgi:hypothetical protein